MVRAGSTGTPLVSWETFDRYITCVRHVKKSGPACNNFCHCCLTYTLKQSYTWLLNILHNTQSQKRPELLCINQ